MIVECKFPNSDDNRVLVGSSINRSADYVFSYKDADCIMTIENLQPNRLTELIDTVVNKLNGCIIIDKTKKPFLTGMKQ